MLVLTITRRVGRILKQISVLIVHLFKGLILLAYRKARNEGKPKSLQAAKILSKQTVVFVKKIKPKLTSAAQLSKGVLILAGRKLKSEGAPKAIQAGQLLRKQSGEFISKTTEKVLEQTSKAIKEDILVSANEGHRKEDTITSVSSEIILEKSKRINLNERLAEEIKENGIECKPIVKIGSLQIERSSYYSHIFPMSPKIVTNRGCIRLQGNNERRNIDLIQIIQKN